MAAAAAEKDLDALDDMSNQQLVDAMLRAKNERRRAESDVQLLANRLAHLRAEEEKARRKIEETKKRASEILDMKARNAAVKEEEGDAQPLLAASSSRWPCTAKSCGMSERQKEWNNSDKMERPEAAR